MFAQLSRKHRPTLLLAGMLFTSTLVLPLHLQAQATPENKTSATTQPSSANTKPDTLTSEQRTALTQLDDADYLVRDLAMTTLLADDTLTDAAIDQMYATASSDEQRVRLRQVAVHQTARRISLKYAGKNDPAILGMSPAPLNTLPNDDDVNPPAVVVRWTFPGSVAFAYLRQGDIITKVNNNTIEPKGNASQVTSAFIQLIAGKRAGDPMSFHVIRDGKELDIHLKLGSDRALQAIYQSARTAQSRQFNADVAHKIEDRLAALDKLATSQPTPLTLTLPATGDASDKTDAADKAATEPAGADQEDAQIIFQ